MRARWLIPTVVVIGVSASVQTLAQDERLPRNVPIPFQPQIGSSWTIKIARERSQTERGATTTQSADVTARVDFIASSEDGFEAVWETLSVGAESILIEGNEVGQSLLVGVPIRLRLGPDGSPIGLDDWNTLRTTLLETVLTLREGPTDHRTLKAFEALLGSWSSELAARVLMQDLGILAICQHTEFQIGVPVEFVSQVPNHLGGPPIDARNIYELVSVDGGAQTARIHYSRTLVPESMTASMLAAAEAMIAATGKDREEALREWEGLSMTNDSSADCVVDLATGAAVEASYDVDVTAGPNARVTDRRKISVSVER
jgi:hypothetical protein